MEITIPMKIMEIILGRSPLIRLATTLGRVVDHRIISMEIMIPMEMIPLEMSIIPMEM